jgi:RHS repeat-associated protein
VVPGQITLTASATDGDGTIAKVEFYKGATLIGTATSSPWSVNWTAPYGTNSNITAKAYDNNNVTTTSTAITLTADNLPVVSVTSPAEGNWYAPNSTVSLSANASDADGNNTITKVDFFDKGVYLHTVNAAPWSYTYTLVSGDLGSHVITAVATDALSQTTTSAPVNSYVGVPLNVAITSPTSGTVQNMPASFALTATASSPSANNSTIAKVEFYHGATLIGTATTSPYSYTWTNATVGGHTVTAKAYDTKGLFTVSSPVTLIVNAPPVVSLTTPANNSVSATPAPITLTASATDSDGTITKVDFYNGATLLGTATTSPYSYNWTGVAVGTYSLTAKATDNNGGVTTSSPVSVKVGTVPTVSLSSGATSYTAPATFTITAQASSTTSTIAHVDFFQNGTPVGSVTTAPYTLTLNNLSETLYSFTATAYDNDGLANQSTPPLNISVSVQPHYVYADQLDTPRLITDAQSTPNPVWSWDSDPFGSTPANDDPNATGTHYEYNLRFPGQYFDKETNLNYNYFRDYDPSTGRYIESDPIGLAGGINTYAYVNENPLVYRDSKGLCIEDLCIGEAIAAVTIIAAEYGPILTEGSVIAASIASGAPVPETGAFGSVRTIASEVGAVQTFGSFRQAKNALSSQAGKDIHHVVEQCQAKVSRSGFSTAQINSTDNLVRLNSEVHDQVSAFYSSSVPAGGTFRDSLNGLPFKEQYEIGIDVIQRVLNGKLK